MLVDNVYLIIKAGSGGDGAATFMHNEGKAKGGPDGGNGGNGGNIYFQGSSNINDLREFRYKKQITAENGTSGSRKNKFGKNARDLIVYLPLGTKVTETATGMAFEILDANTPVLVAKGGFGGKGNSEFKSATNQTPHYAEKGIQGQEKRLFLELKIIADVGLIGLPNAGKSSLLSVLTNANPKIGDYPFTTLEPNLGVLENYVVADIPGLIEGASKGKGLGFEFLKHIEKTKILVHCIDILEKDIKNAYKIVRSEFEKYNPALLEKPEIIALTKSDLTDEQTIKNTLDLLKKTGKEILTVSIYDQNSLNVLKETLLSLLKKHNN